MNKESNSYILLYTVVMIVLAATLLAGTSIVLKDAQTQNQKIDKMEQILRSVGVTDVPKKDVISTYKSLVKAELLVSDQGEVVDAETESLSDSQAFNENIELAFKKKDYSRLPVYVIEKDGKLLYALPLSGAGLWGKIWGYIAVDAADHSTIMGADFGNAGETPGLGAEISTPHFSKEFVGKELYKDGAFKVVTVVQPGKPAPAEGNDYVDGISGGTLTSNGVKDMLAACLTPYQRFLETYNYNAK